MDKSQLMEVALDRYNVHFVSTRSGWQPVRCPNELGHAHGDTNPSASLHLGYGAINCHGCGLKGDAYSIVMDIEQLDFRAAVELLGEPNVEEEQSDWIIL